MSSEPRTPVGAPHASPGTAFLLAGPLALALAVVPLEAQTDFYNLDKERPLRVEDAFTTKRGAFELQLSPLDLSQTRGGGLHYTPSLEVKHGLLPGLEVALGTHLEAHRLAQETETRLGTVELSSLLNLWVEGPRLPAAALRLTAHLPVSGEDEAELELRGILTRGLAGPLRAHLNGALVRGDDGGERWWAGAALDWVLPFRHTLLLAESWISRGDTRGEEIHSAVGLRHQLSSTLAMDVGVGRSWSGEAGRDWTLTFGLTHEFGIRSLTPGGLR